LLALGPGQERALLVVLLLHANERVSTGRLADLLWDESPPDSGAKMVQIYVSRLRRVLAGGSGAEQRLLTEAGGYRLRVEPGELDLERFERLCGEGRRELAGGNPVLAAARLREALLLWRGPPLLDASPARFLERESARLEELRLGALEARLEAELALGEGRQLVDELEALVRQHPVRERLAAQLMLALYRSDRQAEALAVYKRTRDHLTDELGLEPGRPLRELEQAILRQDPALEPAPREQIVGAGAAKIAESMPLEPEPRRRRPSRRIIAAAAALAAAAAAATVIALATGAGRRQPIELAPAAVGVVRNGQLVSQVEVGAAPSVITEGAGALWVARSGASSVSRLDQKTYAVGQTIQVGDGPSGIAVSPKAVWVANGLGGTVSRIDPGSDSVVQTIQVGNGPAAIAYGLGSVWVANRDDQTVSRIDAHTGRVVDTLAAGTDATAIATGAGAVWVADQVRGRVARLEP